ncbi:hypothetical protein BH09ACT10_BH09ACT10_00300 [soil metagenome]
MRKLFAATALAVAILAITPGGPRRSHTAGEPFNEEDIAFLQAIVPHNLEAVQMADQASSRSTDLKILYLATTIAGSQEPEENRARSWLKQWGKQLNPSPHRAVSEPYLSANQDVHGEEFDRLFLAAIIGHHQESISLACTVLDRGESPSVAASAHRIFELQTARIRITRELLFS